MNNGKRPVVSVSKLKGIGVYFEDDLYDLACLKLMLNDSRAEHDASRPTINGLGKLFAGFIDACNPDYSIVFRVIEQHDLPLEATIDWNK